MEEPRACRKATNQPNRLRHRLSASDHAGLRDRRLTSINPFDASICRLIAATAANQQAIVSEVKRWMEEESREYIPSIDGSNKSATSDLNAAVINMRSANPERDRDEAADSP